MTDTYDPTRTAVLLVDPYNDFLSEGGKLWPQAKPVATDVGLLDNLEHQLSHTSMIRHELASHRIATETLRRNFDKIVGTTATAYRDTFRGASVPVPVAGDPGD